MTYTDPIKHVWGTQYDKERQTKRFIEQQTEEAVRTREIQEQAAAASEAQAAYQTSLLEEMSQAQAHDAMLQRVMPQALFDLSQHMDSFRNIAEALLDGHNSLPAEQCLVYHNTAKDFLTALRGINEQYITDFSQKKLLFDLRKEATHIAQRLNAEVPQATRDAYITEYIKNECSILNTFTADRLAALLEQAKHLDELQRRSTEPPTFIDRVEAGWKWYVPGFALIIIGLSLLDGDDTTGLGFMMIVAACVPIFIGIGTISNLEEGNQKLQQEIEALKSTMSTTLPLDQLPRLIRVSQVVRWVDGGWEINSEYIDSTRSRFDELWHI